MLPFPPAVTGMTGVATVADAVVVGVVVGLAWLILSTLARILSRGGSGVPVTKYGKWAVVTGASDGIGKAYATELASRGMNVVLVARNPERLEAAAAEITAKCRNVEVKTIAFDFSVDARHPSYEALRVKVEELGDIGVLVNNVGVSYPGALFFTEVEDYSPGLVDQMIALNVTSTTKMTQFVLPGMLMRRRGAIINISSAAGRIPIGNPFYSEYSASKAYVDFFSRSLHHEYRDAGIHIQCQSPYFVSTKMSKIYKSSLFTPSPQTFAKAAVNAIGRGDSVVPYWPHALQDWLIQSLPHWVLHRYLIGLHKGMRKRFLNKAMQAKETGKAATATTTAPTTDGATSASTRSASKKKV